MTPDEIKLFDRLVQVAEGIANGHLTIMRFTTNWRIAFDTPSSRHDISKMWEGPTFADAAKYLLADLADFRDVSATDEEVKAWYEQPYDSRLPVFRRGSRKPFPRRGGHD